MADSHCTRRAAYYDGKCLKTQWCHSHNVTIEIISIINGTTEFISTSGPL